MAANTMRDFQELLKKSNCSQFEYDEANKRQKQMICDLNQSKEQIENENNEIVSFLCVLFFVFCEIFSAAINRKKLTRN